MKKILVACLLVMGIWTFPLAHADTQSSGRLSPDKTTQRNAPINVIFDTDIRSDIDDALALGMVHALHDRRELNLVAVTVSTDERWCASCGDLVDTFYGHPQIPVGIVHDGLNTEAFRKKYPEMTRPVSRYTQLLSERKKRDGSLVYPHRLIDGTKAPVP